MRDFFLYIEVIAMSKNIFVRVSDETYKSLNQEAKKRGISVYRLVKEILEDYVHGKLKSFTFEEIANISTKVHELDSSIKFLKDLIDETRKNVNNLQKDILLFREITDQIIILEQKINSLEIRIKNIEKTKHRKY